MVTKHKSSDAGNSDMLTRSRKVLLLKENVCICRKKTEYLQFGTIRDFRHPLGGGLGSIPCGEGRTPAFSHWPPKQDRIQRRKPSEILSRSKLSRRLSWDRLQVPVQGGWGVRRVAETFIWVASPQRVVRSMGSGYSRVPAMYPWGQGSVSSSVRWG